MRAALALAAILWVAPAAASTASTDAGLLWTRGPIANLQLAGDVEMHLVDDFVDRTLPQLGSLPVPWDRYDRSIEDASGADATLELLSFGAEGIVIVEILDGQLQLDADGKANSTAAGAALIEASHVYESTSANSYYYEYRAPAGVNWTASETNWNGTGTFRVYAWDADWTLRTTTARTINTGLTSDPPGPASRRDHYRHAVFTVEGTLAASVTGDSTLQAGTVEICCGLRLADGEVSGSAVVQVRDGRLRATPQAASVVPETSLGPWPWAAGMLSVLPALWLAFRLRVFGTGQLWARRAANFYTARRPRVAMLAANLALRLDLLPDAYLVRGAARADRGRRDAMDDFEVAHEQLNGESRALAAYAASKAAAHLGLPAEAGYWLHLAIQDLPEILRDAMQEPAYGRVAAHPEFRRHVRFLGDDPATA